MLKRKAEFVTFCDGWGTSYEIIDRRYRAGQPRQEVIHFREKTVGERRYWDAYVNGIEITRIIAVPEATRVEFGDLFVIEGVQYVVAQKQRQDTQPASWLLSLQSAPIEYLEKGT